MFGGIADAFSSVGDVVKDTAKFVVDPLDIWVDPAVGVFEDITGKTTSDEMKRQAEVLEKQEEEAKDAMERVRQDLNKAKEELGGTTLGQIFVGASEDNIKTFTEFGDAMNNIIGNAYKQLVVKKEEAGSINPVGSGGDDDDDDDGVDTVAKHWTETWSESMDKIAEKNKEHIDNVMGGFSDMTSAMSENIDARYNAELSALKDSEKYRRADSERRAYMEKDLSKKFAKERKRIWKFEKMNKITTAGMNIAEGITKALAYGPIAGPILAGIIGAMGAVQLAMIQSTPPPKFAKGGMVGGNLHSAGGTMIEAERGEFVMNRNAVQRIGADNLASMNAGGGGMNINISAPLIDDTIVDSIIPKIKEAVRRGSDIGL